MPRTRRFISSEVSQRVAAMHSVFVPHARFTAVLEEIGKPLETVGSRELPMCTVVVGPSGIGKSLLIDKLKEPFEGDEEEVEFVVPPFPGLVARHVPLLSLEMPDRPHPTLILNEILKRSSDPKWHERDPKLCEARVVQFIEASRTRGLLFDEAQRMVDRTSDVITLHILEKMKRLASLTGISMAFFGVGRLAYVMEIDGQIRRRWKDPIAFEPYLWPSDEKVSFGSQGFNLTPDQRELIAAYRAFEPLIPMPVHPDVSVLNANHAEAYRMCRRLTYANRGAVGLHKQLLLAAMEELEGFEQITMKLLAKAYASHFRSEPGVINPFTEEWMGQPPPLIRDDVFLLHPRRKQGVGAKSTKREQARELAAALTK